MASSTMKEFKLVLFMHRRLLATLIVFLLVLIVLSFLTVEKNVASKNTISVEVIRVQIKNTIEGNYYAIHFSHDSGRSFIVAPDLNGVISGCVLPINMNTSFLLKRTSYSLIPGYDYTSDCSTDPS